jgi:hypothetical protein
MNANNLIAGCALAAAICSATMLGLTASRGDPAEACRAQISRGEERLRARIDTAGENALAGLRDARQEFATLRADIARGPAQTFWHTHTVKTVKAVKVGKK